MTELDRRLAIHKAVFANHYPNGSYQAREIRSDGSVLARQLSEDDEQKLKEIVGGAPELLDPQLLEPHYRISMKKPLIASPYGFCEMERSYAWDHTVMKQLLAQVPDMTYLERAQSPAWQFLKRGIHQVRIALTDADYDKPFRPVPENSFTETRLITINPKTPQEEKITEIISCPVSEFAQALYKTGFEVIEKVRKEEIASFKTRRDYKCTHESPTVSDRINYITEGTTRDQLSR